jgi:hypothetical protein
MTKAWEETWEAQRYVVEMAGDAGHHLGQFVDDVDDPEQPSCDRDRAQLAAAAPEMARLLLELYRPGWVPHVCPECSAKVYANHDEYEEHDADCRLVAVLRKAGMLSDKSREEP